MEQVRKLVILLDYIEKIDDMLQILDQNGMECRDSKEVAQLRQFHGDLKDQQDRFYLEQVEENLARIQKELAHLSPEEIGFFSQVKNAQPLIDFFEGQKDFESKIQLLNSELQGQELSSDFLADIQVAHHYLRVFLSKNATFREILRHVQQCAAVGHLKMKKPLEVSLDHLIEIKAMFTRDNATEKSISSPVSPLFFTPSFLFSFFILIFFPLLTIIRFQENETIDTRDQRIRAAEREIKRVRKDLNRALDDLDGAYEALEKEKSRHRETQEELDDVLDNEQSLLKRLERNFYRLEDDFKEECALHNRLKDYFGNLQQELEENRRLFEKERVLMELAEQRFEREKDLLKMEFERKAKEDEKVRKVEIEIWKLEEMAKNDESRVKELELAIAKKRQGLQALTQEVDVTPPDWNASWPSVGATAYHYKLDSVALQLDRKSSSQANTTLSIKERPFDKGSFRFAYYGQDGGQRMVFKKLIFSQDFEADRKEHEENLKLHLMASYFAQEFNKKKPQDTPQLKYVGAKIYKYRDHGVETCVFGEEVLDSHFTKYNSNGEFVNRDPEAALPQTFSHFTYIHSGGKLVICDIQGGYSPARREFNLTDPACHKLASGGEAHEFGDSNLGEKGFTQFFSCHQCNQFCRAMGLTPHPSQTK